MNPKPLNEARDEDARHVESALRRAAQKARALAAATRTPWVVVKDGQLVQECPPSSEQGRNPF
ncbi:MAG: hypothetical protein AB1641_19370 [Thermodesulfobacteriota bacterium]